MAVSSGIWHRAAELTPVGAMWCFAWWRSDGLLLCPAAAEPNMTRWRLTAAGEVVDEFTTYAKTLPRFVGQTELARRLIDDLYPMSYIGSGYILCAYRNALRAK